MKSKAYKRLIALSLGGAFLASAGNAFAISLIQAYSEALKNDPTYQSAIHDNEAGQENIAIARAGLLPNASIAYSAGKNRYDVTVPGVSGNDVSHPVYTSKSASLSLRQSILNLEGIATYKKGVAQANYASAQFSARQQELVSRVVSAYIEAQNSEVILRLVEAQRDAMLEQRNSNQRMFALGEGTKTDVLETQAKYDSAESQILEAQDLVTNNRNTLAALVGTEIKSLDPLLENFKARPLLPASFEEWKATALQKNSEIEALRYAVEANQQEVNRARASNAPRIDFTASLSTSDSETINTLNQQYKARSIGVQVNIPLYSGGYASAVTRQSIASREKTKSDLEAKTGQVLVELRKQYNLTFSSIKRMESLQTAVKSAELLVEATRQSIKGGVRVNLDLLNAQQQLYMAKRDLVQGQYGYLLSYMRLRNAAGVLNGSDLQDIASYFVVTR